MLRHTRQKARVLRPVRPNAGVEAAYRGALENLIDEMSRSVTWWVKASYRADPPAMAGLAEDRSSAVALRDVMKRLARRWTDRFNEAADRLAKHFAMEISERSDASLRSILRRAGLTVKFVPTAAQRDIMSATVTANVSLIRSIPVQYLAEVEGLVMRSVQVGGDMGALADELEARHGVTRRRAEIIARDQNHKATSALQRARQSELGIIEAVWVHSGGGKEPRPTHVRNNGERYRVTEGWFDPAEKRYIWPGQLINCRCVSKAVMPGL